MSMNSMPKCLSTILYLILAFIIPPIYGSYCGQSAIPFSLEVRDDGQPVLGCARPACFGWNSKGKKAADSAQFYRIWGRPDGFVRVADLEREKKGNWNGSLTLNGSEYSICDQQYGRDRCSPGHWVGGIAPNAKIQPNSPLKLICCTYKKLANSIQSDQVEVRTGDMVQGGEMLEGKDRREIAFEYIANIQRLFDRNGVLYVVEVRKFACSSLTSMLSAKSSSGMRITATFDGDEQARKMKEEESDGDKENLDQELRIGKPNGGKEEEMKVLAEFSEYEGDLQLKGTTQYSLEDNQQQSSTSSTTQKTKPKNQYLHIGQIGPKMNEEQKQQKFNQISSNFAQQQWNPPQKQIPKNQPLNGQPLLQYQYPPQQQPKPIPILLSQSPFGGYQMHHSPPQQQYSQSLQSHQISNQQLAQSQQLLNQPAAIPLFPNRPFSHHLSSNDKGQPKRLPLLKIPSPEEIENAIPPHGKLLLNNLTRTFLGLQRLF